MEFFNKVLAAEYDFSAIGQFFKDLYNGSLTGSLREMWDNILGIPAVAYVLLVLALLQLFAGKHLLGIQKFVGGFAVGYAASVVFLAPVLADLIPAIADYAWIVGIVFGVIGVLIRKVIYMAVYIIAFAYIPYFVLYSGTLVEALKGQLVIAAAAAVVIVVLAIVLRKWVEMLGLSALGAYCVTKILDVKFGVVALIPLDAKLVTLILIGVLTLIGFIIQVKTRKRY